MSGAMDGDQERGVEQGAAESQPLTLTREMLAEEPPAAPTETRINFEQGMRRLPRLTVLLIAVNLIVFAAELASGALRDKAALIGTGALTRAGVVGGECWRILSAMFLHASFDHLLGNCAILYIVGMALEHAFGLGRSVIIYFTAGVTGALLSILMNPGPSVGASGAIFGVAGAVIVFLHRRQGQFYLRDKRIGLVLLVWAGFQIVTGFLSPMIDNFDHIGGLAGGALAGLLLLSRALPDAASRSDR